MSLFDRDGVVAKGAPAAALTFAAGRPVGTERAAMRLMYATTHNVAEGAGAVGPAGLMSQVGKHEGGRVGVILSGGNMSGPRLAEVLAGE